MKKTIALVLAFVCSIAILLYAYINRSYFEMGGEVTIVAKQESGSKYYITVEQGDPDSPGRGQFLLECTQEQYRSVDIGDVVRCDRYQSSVTYRGTVHKIYD